MKTSIVIVAFVLIMALVRAFGGVESTFWATGGDATKAAAELRLKPPGPPAQIVFAAEEPFGKWLTVRRNNTREEGGNFHPSYTEIVSDYKPVSTKRDDGKWITAFVSDVIQPPR